MAATAKANLPQDPVPTEGQTLQQIQGLTLQQQTEGITLQQIQGLTLQQQIEGLTLQQIEDQYGNISEDEEDEEDELDYVNNNGKFEPEVNLSWYYTSNFQIPCSLRPR